MQQTQPESVSRSKVQRRYRTRLKIRQSGLAIPDDLRATNKGNRMERTDSQKMAVYDHLCRHGKITALQALEKFGTLRLAARILDLRESGIPIKTMIVERGGKRFAEYRLGCETAPDSVA